MLPTGGQGLGEALPHTEWGKGYELNEDSHISEETCNTVSFSSLCRLFVYRKVSFFKEHM